VDLARRLGQEKETTDDQDEIAPRYAVLENGEQQRVAVARAIVGKPLILLADEPTGNLDSKNGNAVMELMKELHDDGATICMVTHDPRYSAVAERTVQLFDGQVVDETDAERSARAEDLVESGFEG
jgi:putative ABC transport system ATP-binding protein